MVQLQKWIINQWYFPSCWPETARRRDTYIAGLRLRIIGFMETFQNKATTRCLIETDAKIGSVGSCEMVDSKIRIPTKQSQRQEERCCGQGGGCWRFRVSRSIVRCRKRFWDIARKLSWYWRRRLRSEPPNGKGTSGFLSTPLLPISARVGVKQQSYESMMAEQKFHTNLNNCWFILQIIPLGVYISLCLFFWTNCWRGGIRKHGDAIAKSVSLQIFRRRAGSI